MNAEPDRPEEDLAEEEEANAGSEAAAAAGEEPATDELATLQAKADENWDRYIRAAAELENVRKRASRDIENAHRFALERFATDMLAVCDSLEMALNADVEASVESLKEGSEATDDDRDGAREPSLDPAGPDA